MPEQKRHYIKFPPGHHLHLQKKRIKRVRLLFLLGAIFIGIAAYWNLSQTIQLSYFTPKVIPIKKSHPIPTEVTIPAIKLQLPIEETTIANGVWQIAENGASHLTISARPGESGPIIIYGHNTNNRFGPLLQIKTGNKILIETADTKMHQYKIVETQVVSPKQLDIFTQKPGEALIIYTCTGFADLQRFVIIGIPYEGFIYQ